MKVENARGRLYSNIRDVGRCMKFYFEMGNQHLISLDKPDRDSSSDLSVFGHTQGSGDNLGTSVPPIGNTHAALIFDYIDPCNSDALNGGEQTAKYPTYAIYLIRLSTNNRA